MTFSPTIPLSTDLISTSQSDIQTNFAQSNTIFGYDHYSFNDATVANRGLHKQMQIPAVLGADPGLASPACSIYTKTVGAASQLFFQNGALAADVKQLTNLTVNSAANAGTGGGTNYWIDTPWGLRFAWGQINVAAGARTVIVAGAASMLTFSATINGGGGATVGCSISGANQLTITTTATESVVWFSICTI